MNKNVKSIIVLLAICLVASAALAVVNKFTAPLIEEYKQQQALAAYYEVMPNAKGFEEVSTSDYADMPAEITKIFKETSGNGYVFEITTKGYATGLVIVCGIDKDGKITNVKVLQSNETPTIGGKVENESYTNQYIGQDSSLSGIGDGWKITGATVTSGAFKGAVTKAFTAFNILGGNYVPPVIKDPKDLAMPNAQGFEAVDMSTFENLPETIKEIYRETSGMGYVYKISSWGYEPNMIIMCGINSEGKITGVTLVSSNETDGLGTQVGDAAYTNQYIGKDETLEGITGVSGATISSAGFKNGVKDAFVANNIVAGTYVPPVETDPKLEVMPNATEFEQVDLSTFTGLPTDVKEVYKEKTGLGYVVKVSVWGYNEGMVILCGIDMEGKITGVKLVSSNETPGLGTQVGDKPYTDQYIGKDVNLDGIVDISGATYSSAGFKSGIKEAFKAYEIINTKEGE